MDNFLLFLEKRNVWSLNTFGNGQRTLGIIRHIESELDEVRETPDDLMEWVDIILLALDGAFRAGHSAEETLNAIYKKQEINAQRVWEITKSDEPSFHKK